jgi:hypothetical protein
MEVALDIKDEPVNGDDAEDDNADDDAVDDDNDGEGKLEVDI